MTSKERVYAALNRTATDRTPTWMWYHPAIYQQLQEQYRCSADEVDAMLGNDIKSVHVTINREMFRPLATGERFVDDWGVTWTREGWYNQVCANPLAGKDIEALREYRFPDPEAAGRFDALGDLCARFAQDYFIGVDVSGSIFEPCYHIRGMEDLLIDMLESPEIVGEFLDHATAFTTAICRKALEFPVDWIWLGDDVGGQSEMMLSPGTWRTLLKPRLASIIAAVKAQRPGIFVAYHSCGAIHPIIPDLIEIGVDVLNPLQPLCPSMDPLALKAEFGGQLAFMGGLDTQDFLIHATPEEIRATVPPFIEGMANNGGYIFAASHTIQPDTPMENIFALAEVATGRGLPSRSL